MVKMCKITNEKFTPFEWCDTGAWDEDKETFEYDVFLNQCKIGTVIGTGNPMCFVDFKVPEGVDFIQAMKEIKKLIKDDAIESYLLLEIKEDENGTKIIVEEEVAGEINADGVFALRDDFLMSNLFNEIRFNNKNYLESLKIKKCNN